MSRWILVCAVTWVACAPSRIEVQSQVMERVRAALEIGPEAPAEPRADGAARTLTADAAVARGLWANPDVQAALASVEDARGGLAGARLHNPVASASARFDLDGGGTTLELGLVQNLFSLLLLPTRRRLAEGRLQEAVLDASAQVLRAAADIRSAWYALQAAQHVLALRETIAESYRVGYVLARRMAQAGNLSELDLIREQVPFEEARIALARARLDVTEHRERMNRLLGLHGDSTRWSVPPRLPPLPQTLPDLGDAERLAVERSPEVAAARQRVAVAAAAVGVESTAGWLDDLAVGAEAEREDGGWSVGPSVEVPLPLFDQGQGARIEEQAALRRARDGLYAAAVGARAQAREDRERLAALHRIAEHQRTVLLPARDEVVRLTKQRYDFMLVGVFHLLEARRDQFEAYVEYLETVRDFWMAVVALEHTTARRWPMTPTTHEEAPHVETP